ncbi:MAG: hypothetical protein ACFFBD_12425 [Candidatus Hodarchaeota archaeon]
MCISQKIDTIIVLGKEIPLPKPVEYKDEEQVLSLIFDIDKEAAQTLQNVSTSMEIQSRKIIIYRRDAIFG